MSKEVTTNGQTVVGINELIALKEELSAKNQLIGELKGKASELIASHNKELKRFKEEITPKEPKVHIQLRTEGDWYGDNTRIYYENLDEATKLFKTIAEENKKRAEYKLKLENEQLSNIIEDLNHNLRSAKAEEKRKRRELKFDFDQELANEKRSYKEELVELEKANRDLDDEIRQLKDNKTDEIIEANRKQEIIDLKSYIKSLEEKIEAIQLERNKVVNWKAIFGSKEDTAKIEAEKQLAKEKYIADKVSNEYPYSKSFWINWVRNW